MGLDENLLKYWKNVIRSCKKKKMYLCFRYL